MGVIWNRIPGAGTLAGALLGTRSASTADAENEAALLTLGTPITAAASAMARTPGSFPSMAIASMMATHATITASGPIERPSGPK